MGDRSKRRLSLAKSGTVRGGVSLEAFLLESVPLFTPGKTLHEQDSIVITRNSPSRTFATVASLCVLLDGINQPNQIKWICFCLGQGSITVFGGRFRHFEIGSLFFLLTRSELETAPLNRYHLLVTWFTIRNFCDDYLIIFFCLDGGRPSAFHKDERLDALLLSLLPMGCPLTEKN